MFNRRDQPKITYAIAPQSRKRTGKRMSKPSRILSGLDPLIEEFDNTPAIWFREPVEFPAGRSKEIDTPGFDQALGSIPYSFIMSSSDIRSSFASSLCNPRYASSKSSR